LYYCVLASNDFNRIIVKMMRNCKCKKWQAELKKVEDLKAQGVDWTSEHSFFFCPYCGVRLIAPCYTCGIPANTHTGNTLYWYEDKDFCSASCARKLDMNLSKETESRET